MNLMQSFIYREYQASKGNQEGTSDQWSQRNGEEDGR